MPHIIHPSLDRPHLPPETASDTFSHFATIHFPDRHIDRQRDRWQMGYATGP